MGAFSSNTTPGRAASLTTRRTARCSVVALCLFFAACSQADVETPGGQSVEAAAQVNDEAPPIASRAPVVPTQTGPYGPTLLTFEDPEAAREFNWVDDAQSCGSCHQPEYEEWRSSLHHYASFQNPWYRAVVERFREKAGNDAANFCAGCHDPAMLATDTFLPFEDNVPNEAFVGVSCTGCHGITDAGPNGNADLMLRVSDQRELAERDVEAHRAMMSPEVLRDSTACLSCHKGILSTHTGNAHVLTGMDDASAWQQSAFTGNGMGRLDAVDPRDCIGCHMRGGDGVSHAFPGAHTLLAAGRSEGARHLEDVQQFLRTSASVRAVSSAPMQQADGTAVWLRREGGLCVERGRAARVDVLVVNEGVGHRFPGGTLDLQDTEVRVTLRDPNGMQLATSDTRPFRLAAFPVDSSGNGLLLHETEDMRAVAWNHTIPARDEVVVPFELDEATTALLRDGSSLHVELVHRRHPAPFYDWVCAQSGEPGARLVRRAAERRGVDVVDPCVAQPETVLNSDVVGISAVEDARCEGTDATTLNAEELWRYAEGVAQGLHEHQPLAAELAGRAEGAAATRSELLRVELLRARILARSGRAGEAASLASEVFEESGHPAALAVAYDAFARVWRWEEAAAVAGQLVELLPNAELAWMLLARAQASAGDNEAALRAARTGLEIQPRSPQLLRTQYLSLLGLVGAQHPHTDTARGAWARFRVDDATLALQARCYDDVAHCSSERTPLTPRPLVLVDGSRGE